MRSIPNKVPVLEFVSVPVAKAVVQDVHAPLNLNLRRI